MTSHLIHRQLTSDYPVIAHGDGVFLFDRDGKRYLDGSGGAAVSCLGHRHPKVTAAVKDQLDRIAYAHTAFFTNAPAEELAEWLTARAPAGFGKAMFVSGGSEATEAALKFARQVQVERGEPRRTRFIARQQSYHGTTLAALAVGGHTARRRIYEPVFDAGLLDGAMSRIAPCYAYRHQRPDESAEAYGARAAAALEAEIQRVGPDTVAAFVAETVVGATAGVIPPAPGYFREIRRICDRYGVLLILDEVMCGMGRTGALYACAQEQVVPDILTAAKGLGAGYQPIGAMLARDEHVDTIAAGTGAPDHGHTYLAHTTACAAALAVQKTIEEDNLLENVQARGAQLMAVLQQRLGQHPHVGDIRGRGLFVGIELVEDRDTKRPFPPEHRLAAKLKSTAMRNGLVCYPAGGTADGINGDHVLLAPAFVIRESEVEMLVDLLERSLGETLGAVEASGGETQWRGAAG